MTNKKIILVILILIVAIGMTIIIFNSKNKNVKQTETPVNSEVVYNNTNYGFNFSLPISWKGFTIVENTWKGSPLNNPKINETGPKLLIRNPKWTTSLPYEDLPILIFTIPQWNAYIAENFSIGAAPIKASELARNNKYVFALPPRWDFDYSKGYEEAQNILKTKPLKPFDINKTSILEDGKQCYTYNHETTKTEPYTVNEFLNISINGEKVTGTKSGTQNGPDMTNGYNGTIEGTLSKDTITDVFSYVIEGAPNKESEIYKAKADKTGIEKLRYPLIEKGGMLVPDTTKEFQTLLYARVGCTASN